MKKSAGRSYIERIAQLVSYAASFLEDTRTQAPLLQISAELWGYFQQYELLRLENRGNCIDFSDAENMLLDILREKTVHARRPRGKSLRVMIYHP